MKKKLLMTAMLVLALSATACSKKADEPATTPEVTTEAPVTTEATTEAETETEEEIEEDFMTGIITKFTDTVLTVKNDDDDSEKDYDISKAEVVQEFPFSEGDWVEISYPAETTESPVPAIHVEVIESIIGENTDPSVEGTITDATMNTLTLKLEDGNTYSFTTSNAYVVAKNGITNDKKATVTYIGDIDDTDSNPVAVKVVMEDSYNSPDAELNAFIGEVAQIEPENNSIVLEAENGDFYTFVNDDIDFTDYEVGSTLKIFYTGSITKKEIAATKIG